MCDTIVALGNSTVDGSVIFGKNSDREPNEAHEVVIIPAACHPAGSKVKCTYIEIPQVEDTCQVLLAKPFWIWGAEMGSNQYGVTIGNEAVFTKTPYGKKPGLIGMDFLRLALERSQTAGEALDWIIRLLEEHGQGGNCGFAHKLFYHNSYLICDFESAWVLETSGREWAAEKVVDVRTISNAITIGSSWDRASRNLVSEAVTKGWCKKEEDFDFARCYSEPIYTRFSDGRRRQSCTTTALKTQKGNISTESMIATLRTHRGTDEGWTPDAGITGADVCMHAGWGPARGSQTTGSMVTVLKKGQPPVHWVTGTAAPCTSLFKPVWMDTGIPETGQSPAGTYNSASLYWRHEALHREILRDYSSRIRFVKPRQTDFENEYRHLVDEVSGSDLNARRKVSDTAFRDADALEEGWMRTVKETGISRQNTLLYRNAWVRFNKEAGME